MYDPELPGGFQDADFEARELEEVGRTLDRIRKTGKCAHGWRQGKPGRPARPSDLVKCLDCGKEATVAELDEDRTELLALYG